MYTARHGPMPYLYLEANYRLEGVHLGLVRASVVRFYLAIVLVFYRLFSLRILL
jgi:hypothetical protein